MQWQNLGPGTEQEGEWFWLLPLEEKGGKLWVRLPSVPVRKTVFVGLGNELDSESVPARFEGITTNLETFDQYLSFDLPPALEKPFIGIRADGLTIEFQPHFLLQEIVEMGFYLAAIEDATSSFVPSYSVAPPIEQSQQGDQFILRETGETFILDGDTWKGEIREDSEVVTLTFDADNWEAADSLSLPVLSAFKTPNEAERIVVAAYASSVSSAFPVAARMILEVEGEGFEFELVDNNLTQGGIQFFNDEVGSGSEIALISEFKQFNVRGASPTEGQLVQVTIQYRNIISDIVL